MPSKTWATKTATNKQQRGSPRPSFGGDIFFAVLIVATGYGTRQKLSDSEIIYFFYILCHTLTPESLYY